MKELISIIIPIYNSEKYLKKGIDSILNQTYKNIELLLIDDGSKDNSKEICKNYEKNDNRIKYFYKKNSGVSDTRNYGLKKATGEYIMFIDSDDYIDKNYIECMYKSLKNYKVNISISGFELDDFKYKKIKSINYGKTKLYNQEEIFIDYINNRIFSSSCKMLIKKSIINNLFETNLKYGEDFLFSYYLTKNNNFVYVNNTGYHYYQNNNSATHEIDKKNIKKYIEDNEYVFYKIDEINKKYSDIIKSKLVTKYNNAFIKAIKSNSLEIQKEIIKKLKDTNFSLKFISYENFINKFRIFLLKMHFFKLYIFINKIIYKFKH